MDYNFGPKDAIEARIFAEESLRVDIQVAIHNVMVQNGVSRLELATAVGWTVAKVDGIFDDRDDLSLRDFAAICHYLSVVPEVYLTPVPK